MDRNLRHRAPDWRIARSVDPPRQHSRDERRKLPPGAKPRPQVHRNRLSRPALSWPQRAKAASQPPAIWGARLTGRRLVARVMPKPKVAYFCAAQWPAFTPPLTHNPQPQNALFAGHDEGGRTWARMASIIETCKLNAVDPYAYMRTTLTAIANRHRASRIDDLMPWAFQNQSSGK